MAGEALTSMMNAAEWYQTTSGWMSVVVSSVGGGVAIAGFVSKLVTDQVIETKKAALAQETERLKGTLNAELERIKGEIARETETHKTRMKKVELFQGKEIEAALEFQKISKDIQPKRQDLESDYYEACVDIVPFLGSIHKKIYDYLTRNSIFISAKSVKIVESCSALAEKHQFDIAGPEDSASSDAVAAVEKLLGLLKEAEDQLVADVKMHSSS